MNRPTTSDDNMDAATLRKLAERSNDYSYYLQAFQLERDANTAMILAGYYTVNRIEDPDYITDPDTVDYNYRKANPYFSEVVDLVWQSDATNEQFTNTLKAILTNLFNQTIMEEVDRFKSRYFLSLYNEIDTFLYEAMDKYRTRITCDTEYAHVELMTMKLLHRVLYRILCARELNKKNLKPFLHNPAFYSLKLGDRTEVYNLHSPVLCYLKLSNKAEEYKEICIQLRKEIARRDPTYQVLDWETNIQNNSYFEGFTGARVLAQRNTDIKGILKRNRPSNEDSRDYFQIFAWTTFLTNISCILGLKYFAVSWKDIQNANIIFPLLFLPMPIELWRVSKRWKKAAKYAQKISISNLL